MSRAFGRTVRTDALFGGGYKLRGTVYEAGAPVRRRLRLHQRSTGRPIREVVSGDDGVYDIQGIAFDQYYVVAFDYGAEPVNAAISDQLILEPMP
jgi:hypothetical protein